MKKIWLAIAGVVVLLLTLVMVGCGTAATTAANNNGSTQQQGLWVNGEGKVEIDPNLAIITLGIQTQDTSVASAQSQASDAMTKVLQALKDQGIADTDIQTQYFNITQITNWDSQKNQQVVTGYQVSNTVTVKVHDMTKPGPIIDVVVAAGGDYTRVNGIQFTLEDPSDAYVQARALALDHAMSKAKEIAAKTGIKLGKITYITESSGNNYPVYRNYTMSDSAMGVPAATVSTPVSVGQLEITADVQIAYAIN